MNRFVVVWLAALMVSVAGPGCSKETEEQIAEAADKAGEALDEAAKTVKEKVGEAREGIAELASRDNRERYAETMRKRLNAIQAELRAISQKAGAKGKAAARTLGELVTDERKARMLLDELGKSSEEGWDKAKEAYEDGVNALERAVQEAGERLK